MFACESCGASLHFDIVSQKLRCDHCENEYEVEAAEALRTAQESEADGSAQQGGMEVYSFVCPQCAGIIYGDRQDMTGFCRYCGTPVELAGRLTRMERPQVVIPFQKTKDDCKKIFQKMAKRSPFLPSGFQDAEHIESFRGIYMPYYMYHVAYDGAFEAHADGKQKRKGDYIYTDRYRITGSLRGEYEGFEHDSSSTFQDEISEAIGPFITQEHKAFRAGYLAGFYADAADEENQYGADAIRTANRRLHKRIREQVKQQKRSLQITDEEKYPAQDIIRVEAKKAMYPVWFMSYKNGDRVAYAAVNGQTGKITADLPVDFKKFLLAVALLTIPLYLLVNRIFFLMPRTMLSCYTAGSLLTTYYLHGQADRILEHDGIAMPTREERKKKAGREQRKRPAKKKSIWGSILIWGMALLGIVAMAEAFGILSILFPVLFLFFGFWFAIRFAQKSKVLAGAGVPIRGRVFALCAAGLNALAILLILLRPVSDLWYYGGCAALLCGMLAELLQMVRNHNCLATRKPVQFAKEGGDDNA